MAGRANGGESPLNFVRHRRGMHTWHAHLKGCCHLQPCKRPAEVTWNFRRPLKPLPLLPSSFRPRKDHDDHQHASWAVRRHLRSSSRLSVDIDSAWLPVKEAACTMGGSSFDLEWDEKSLRMTLDNQRNKIFKKTTTNEEGSPASAA